MSRPLVAVRRSMRSLVVLLAAVSAIAASALAYGDGVDISHWQGSVNWSAVRSDDVTFAFMKATEGTNYTDPTLQRNWSGAEQVGIYRAAYHFARPSTASGSAAAQARYFVSKAGTFQDKGDLPPVLDLEATGGLGPAALRSWVATWLSTVEDLTGRTPILYFSPYFWIDNLGNSTAFTRYPLWIAHYTANGPLVPGGWRTWTFWQRTSSGHVDGISGNVDLNRFNGTSAQLAALARSTGGSGAPVAPGPTLPVVAGTAVTMTPSSTAPRTGEQVAFTGSLSRVTPARTLGNRPVELWSRPVGSTWVRVGGATTDITGHYSTAATMSGTADYLVKFLATPAYAASASPTARLVAPADTEVALDLRKDRTTVRAGARLMLYGHLTSRSGGVPRQVVRYYKRFPGGHGWTYVAKTSSLAPTGWHSIIVYPKVTRVWKAVYSGSSTYLPRTSSYLTVRVR